MNRCVVGIFAATLLSGALQAQSGASISAELKQTYEAVKQNISNAAEKMPEDGYAFKPAADVRSFAQVVGHVIEAQMRTCAAVLGEHKGADGGSKTSKADVVAGLKASFDECDKAYSSVTDANALQAITTPRGERTRAGALVGNIAHDEEQWGIMTVYMRVKGIAPK